MRGWQLLRAYILFLIDEEAVVAGQFEGASRLYPVNLEKQIKALVVDKGISGPGVFILKILQYIQSRRYTDVIHHVDAMRQHASRYLGDDQLVRTSVFLRMLASIPSSGFDSTEVRRNGKAIWRGHPQAHHLRIDSAEIVPYEVLWEIIIYMLERNQPLRKR